MFWPCKRAIIRLLLEPVIRHVQWEYGGDEISSYNIHVGLRYVIQWGFSIIHYEGVIKYIPICCSWRSRWSGHVLWQGVLCGWEDAGSDVIHARRGFCVDALRIYLVMGMKFRWKYSLSMFFTEFKMLRISHQRFQRLYIYVTMHCNRSLFHNQPDTLFIQFLFCYKTLHVSGNLSAHHQEFSTVQSALGSFMQVFDDRFQAESGRNCSSILTLHNVVATEIIHRNPFTSTLSWQAGLTTISLLNALHSSSPHETYYITLDRLVVQFQVHLYPSGLLATSRFSNRT
jgi:hypothetical protein